MVFVFISTVVDPPVMMFMGQHQEENEELIKGGYPDDVWFHVDKLSSAHVYLRMPRGMSIDTIPEALLEDCCQLVKRNSIQGWKLQSVSVVFTTRDNLKKTAKMAVGEVGFHKINQVKRRIVEKKLTNGIVNRLEKTKWKETTDSRGT